MKENKNSTIWITSDTSTPTHSYEQLGMEPKKTKESQKHLVYGLKGIADFLHQSITTAWRLKNSGKYDAAISQNGRCIITDTDKLLELMRLDQGSKLPQYDNDTHYYNMYYEQNC